MPQVRIDETLNLHYELDDFTDPWTTPETMLLIHGVADTSKAWFAWIPQLARRFRVLRPDLRGFGQSTIPPREYQWSLAALAKDLKNLLEQLQIPSVHVVGQRVGGSVAMQFAHDYPGNVKSLTVIGDRLKSPSDDFQRQAAGINGEGSPEGASTFGVGEH